MNHLPLATCRLILFSLLVQFSLVISSCGRINGNDGDNNSGHRDLPPPPANPSDHQTLVYLESLFLTPTLKFEEPVSDIDYLIESNSIDVSGFREIILYGINYQDIDTLPHCKTTQGTTVVMSPNSGIDIYFGMEKDGQMLKGSIASNISELSRHLVSGNVMMVYLGSYKQPGVSYPNGETPASIDQSTCQGKLELKVVGVK